MIIRSVNASEGMSRSCLSIPVNGAGRLGTYVFCKIRKLVRNADPGQRR